MNTLHFVNGNSLELTDLELLNMTKKVHGMGLKTHRTRYLPVNYLIFLNSTTVTHIELDEKEFEVVVPPQPEVGVPAAVEVGVLEEEVEEVEEEVKETQQQRNDRALAEMVEKSDCAGNAHVGKEQIIHYQDVMIKKKGAKTSLPSRRYFPVCSFCGLRQKYVKADSLTDDQKANAKVWNK